MHTCRAASVQRIEQVAKDDAFAQRSVTQGQRDFGSHFQDFANDGHGPVTRTRGWMRHQLEQLWTLPHQLGLDHPARRVKLIE